MALGVLGVSGLSGLSGAAWADSEVIEEILVTGSRISRDRFSSPSPISVFDEQQLTNSGLVTVDEFLKEVPAFTGFQYGVSTNNGNIGLKAVSLRGLGAKRTLVLLNGRRQVGSFIGGSGDVGAVDLNTVPHAMIERLEVLKDGASTIYGSDALAGVVNIILKEDFEGLEVRASSGAGTEGWDAPQPGLVGNLGSGRRPRPYGDRRGALPAARAVAARARLGPVRPAPAARKRRVHGCSGRLQQQPPDPLHRIRRGRQRGAEGGRLRTGTAIHPRRRQRPGKALHRGRHLQLRAHQRADHAQRTASAFRHGRVRPGERRERFCGGLVHAPFFAPAPGPRRFLPVQPRNRHAEQRRPLERFRAGGQPGQPLRRTARPTRTGFPGRMCESIGASRKAGGGCFGSPSIRIGPWPD